MFCACPCSSTENCDNGTPAAEKIFTRGFSLSIKNSRFFVTARGLDDIKKGIPERFDPYNCDYLNDNSNSERKKPRAASIQSHTNWSWVRCLCNKGLLQGIGAPFHVIDVPFSVFAVMEVIPLHRRVINHCHWLFSDKIDSRFPFLIILINNLDRMTELNISTRGEGERDRGEAKKQGIVYTVSAVSI